MSLDMFWGGAPQPINTPHEALAQLRANEFALEEDNEPGHLSDEEPVPQEPPTGDTEAVNEEESRGKLRVLGGVAAISKRINADYDSDDARIIELKQQSYSDEYVAAKLTEEGRIRYVPKTVGSRWLRLRKVLEKREDERLDDELSDWHVGEDEELNNIKTEVDKKFEVQFQRLRDRMWSEVSIYLAEKTVKRKYTANACQERYEALKNGTALLPIELDDDQEGRRLLREERIIAAQARRDAIEQEKKDLEAAREARIEEKKQLKIDEAKRRQMEIKKRQDAAAERRRQKQEKQNMVVQAREAREQYLELIRLERDWELEKIRVEREIFKEITGKNLFGKAATARDRSNKRKSGVTLDWESDEEDLDDMEDSASDADDEEDLERTDAGANFAPKRPKKTPSKKRSQPARRASSKRTRLTEAEFEGSANEDETTAHEPGSSKVRVTKATLLNPRSILNNGELKAIIRRRDITPGWQENETHAEVVARLQHIDESLNVNQLRALCKQEFLSPSGKKEELIRRLAGHDAERSFAGQSLDIASHDVEFMLTYDGYHGEFRKYLDEAVQEARDRGEEVVGLDDEDDEDAMEE
ncbi:hypothetical protein CB0940_06309 [Cercospora beticola]|uniref:SAP domain-containing protein n=1 Tax=Cercospora beticola TaxID=122368 RepID=A0A2G5HYG4_CERBT|nr:hypothetical protein CB0940_06309 [Cercospora beticola]PIA97323.1 hypothetical protein CB0940_06309 [Cercospora beticola]WPA98932.1 hypothetical protein RHO25_003545 [Cercospora beticola]CAK1360229.1 unnamed protein product [Cercospora beticola]